MTTWTGYVGDQPFAVSQKAKGAVMAQKMKIKQDIPGSHLYAYGGILAVSTLTINIQKRSAGSFISAIAEGKKAEAALGMLIANLDTNVRATGDNKGKRNTNTANLTEVYKNH